MGADELFNELRALRFDPNNRPIRHENLLDILEVAAVHAGNKPAHLNGQGFRSAGLLTDLEQLAKGPGLHSLRTHKIIPHWFRKPRIDPAIYEWDRAEFIRLTKAEPDVVWIFRDPQLSNLIESVVSGSDGLAELLAYPECCVREEAELHVQMKEHLVDGLRKKYGTDEPSELIELLRQDAGVEFEAADLVEYHTAAPWREKFHYVSFSPCRSCAAISDSPAQRVNAEMRQLAHDLSPDFAKEIELANIRHEAQQETPHETPFQPGTQRVKKVGRNEPCPCGSGNKYKKCHGA